jgi:hypothetical protein
VYGTSITPSQIAGHALSRWKNAAAAGDSAIIATASTMPTPTASTSPAGSLRCAGSRRAAVRRASTYCRPPDGIAPISPAPSSAPSAPYSAGPKPCASTTVKP